MPFSQSIYKKAGRCGFLTAPGHPRKPSAPAFAINRVSAKEGTEDWVGVSPVRLGIQVAFGRVHRKTEPTGPGCLMRLGNRTYQTGDSLFQLNSQEALCIINSVFIPHNDK